MKRIWHRIYSLWRGVPDRRRPSAQSPIQFSLASLLWGVVICSGTFATLRYLGPLSPLVFGTVLGSLFGIRRFSSRVGVFGGLIGGAVGGGISGFVSILWMHSGLRLGPGTFTASGSEVFLILWGALGGAVVGSLCGAFGQNRVGGSPAGPRNQVSRSRPIDAAPDVTATTEYSVTSVR